MKYLLVLSLTLFSSAEVRGQAIFADGFEAAPATGDGSLLGSMAEAIRFLQQAGFGGDLATANALVGTDAAEWVQDQLSRPRTQYLQEILSRLPSDPSFQGKGHTSLFWNATFTGDDVLRQRMVFALSQLLVVADRQFVNPARAIGYYQDVLSEHAFGNYRDLLEAITYTPAMADYLTYLRNQKGDPATGRVPDENYAREILQLFSIGVIELNLDGTPKLVNGQEVETYNNNDIQGLAKVFTGLSLKGGTFFDFPAEDAYDSPLEIYQAFHSTEEKRFLGTTIAANTPAAASIDQALDTIFAHPNLAPFIAKQLIQRFTDSSPDPSYIGRVATAFETGNYQSSAGIPFGTGQRGDLAATIAAVVLDASAHRDPATLSNTDGKLREPVLKLANWVRAFNVAPALSEREFRFENTALAANALAQQPFRSPSVFNFFRPGFVAPGTLSGAAGLTAPEFQVVNEAASVGYINFMTAFIFDQTGASDGQPSFEPDYAEALALADDPAALVAHLNLLLTGNRMSAQEIAAIVEAVAAFDVVDPASDNLSRVRTAILLVCGSPSYGVIR